MAVNLRGVFLCCRAAVPQGLILQLAAELAPNLRINGVAP